MSSSLAQEYHSITFYKSSVESYTMKRNTWDNWHMIPTSRPCIAMPKINTKFVDIPGADGQLDLTEIFGGVSYSTRTGNIDFALDPDYYDDWATFYSDVATFFHGRALEMVLDDDPTYLYKGRFELGQWKTDKNYSTVTVKYTLDPYKYLISDQTSKRL